jgi:GDP-mannose 4,6-dehydratase
MKIHHFTHEVHMVSRSCSGTGSPKTTESHTGSLRVQAFYLTTSRERRGSEFVTRKITLGLAEWLRTKTPIELGNLDAKRDWGHAQDYVEAMWLMLQQESPEDFVVGTGQTHSIREFIETAMRVLHRDITWEGAI